MKLRDLFIFLVVELRVFGLFTVLDAPLGFLDARTVDGRGGHDARERDLVQERVRERREQ
jgi:hypothetical protein